MLYALMAIVCLTPFIIGYGWRWLFKRANGNVALFYSLHFLYSVAVIGLFYMLDKELFGSDSLLRLLNSQNIPGFIVDGIVIIFVLPLMMEFTYFFVHEYGEKKKKLVAYSGDLLPEHLLPRSIFQWLLFAVFVFANVVLEELLFRQFLFSLLSRLWDGGIVISILLSSLLFMFAHFKAQWREKFILFLEGIGLAIFFCWSKSIIWVIGLHFILNATEIVVAFKLILWKNKHS